MAKKIIFAFMRVKKFAHTCIEKRMNEWIFLKADIY